MAIVPVTIIRRRGGSLREQAEYRVENGIGRPNQL
jgi:hypothetical protein